MTDDHGTAATPGTTDPTLTTDAPGPDPQDVPTDAPGRGAAAPLTRPSSFDARFRAGFVGRLAADSTLFVRANARSGALRRRTPAPLSSLGAPAPVRPVGAGTVGQPRWWHPGLRTPATTDPAADAAPGTPAAGGPGAAPATRRPGFARPALPPRSPLDVPTSPRGLPTVVRKVPDESSWTPGSFSRTAVPRGIPMRLPAEVRAAGPMLTPQDRRRRPDPARAEARSTGGTTGTSPGNAPGADSQPTSAGTRAATGSQGTVRPDVPAPTSAGSPPARRWIRRRALAARIVADRAEHAAAQHAARRPAPDTRAVAGTGTTSSARGSLTRTTALAPARTARPGAPTTTSATPSVTAGSTTDRAPAVTAPTATAPSTVHEAAHASVPAAPLPRALGTGALGSARHAAGPGSVRRQLRGPSTARHAGTAHGASTAAPADAHGLGARDHSLSDGPVVLRSGLAGSDVSDALRPRLDAVAGRPASLGGAVSPASGVHRLGARAAGSDGAGPSASRGVGTLARSRPLAEVAHLPQPAAPGSAAGAPHAGTTPAARHASSVVAVAGAARGGGPDAGRPSARGTSVPAHGTSASTDHRARTAGRSSHRPLRRSLAVSGPSPIVDSSRRAAVGTPGAAAGLAAGVAAGATAGVRTATAATPRASRLDGALRPLAGTTGSPEGPGAGAPWAPSPRRTPVARAAVPPASQAPRASTSGPAPTARTVTTSGTGQPVPSDGRTPAAARPGRVRRWVRGSLSAFRPEQAVLPARQHRPGPVGQWVAAAPSSGAPGRPVPGRTASAQPVTGFSSAAPTSGPGAGPAPGPTLPWAAVRPAAAVRQAPPAPTAPASAAGVPDDDVAAQLGILRRLTDRPLGAPPAATPGQGRTMTDAPGLPALLAREGGRLQPDVTASVPDQTALEQQVLDRLDARITARLDDSLVQALEDRVVRRVEDRLLDELSRHGSSFTPGVF